VFIRSMYTISTSQVFCKNYNMSSILFIHSGYRPFNYTLFKKLADSSLGLNFLFIQREKQDGDNRMPVQLKKKMKYKSLNLCDKKILRNTMGPGLGIRGSMSLFIKLSKEIIMSKNEIIITATEHPIHSKIAFFWTKILRKKIIIWTESWYKTYRENFCMRLYHIISTFILKEANAILARGTTQKHYCEKLGIPSRRIFLFNRCSEDLSQSLIKGTSRLKLRVHKKKIILFMGRIIPLKGLDDLIFAFSKIEKMYRDTVLLICGDGNYRKYCEILAKRLLLKNVYFEGMVDREIVPDYFAACDIFVLPSKKYKGQMEGWGSVLNEAASMAKPIITTDAVGGAPDIVHEGVNGYIVKNGNVEELYNAICKLLDENNLRKTMGKRSRFIFEQFNDFNKAINNLTVAVDYVKCH